MHDRSPAPPPDPEAPGVVVLGGSGCIGRHICAAFAHHGYRVTVVARTPAPHLAQHAFHPLDLLTNPTDALTDLLTETGAHVVVNATDMAGATDVTSAADGGAQRATELLAANAGLSHTLIQALQQCPKPPRLVHIGTIHEYGPGQPGIPLAEDHTPRPTNAYARAKLAGSQAVLAAAHTGTLDAAVLRLVNTAGPYPTPASFPGKLLPRLRAAAHTGAPLTLDVAPAMRDWVDVRDVAEAAVQAARRPLPKRVFNIGSGIAVPMRELVTHLLAAADLPATAISEDPGTVHSLGANWVQADIRRARTLLHWQPRIPLRQTLKDLWDAGHTSR
ncbi:NAD-dependent epimerase/dehydratase family protein [Streptomyces sp. DB-54]